MTALEKYKEHESKYLERRLETKDQLSEEEEEKWLDELEILWDAMSSEEHEEINKDKKRIRQFWVKMDALTGENNVDKLPKEG